VYLVDVNILLYAVNKRDPHSEAAQAWLDDALNGPVRTVGLPWQNLLGFLRLATNPRMFARPLRILDTWEIVEDWVRRPAAWIPVPGQRHMAHLERMVRSAQPTGNLIHDAHLAALASEHALTIVSADSDFAKFDGVKWMNPLSGS
jgi:uncharacterized protein